MLTYKVQPKGAVSPGISTCQGCMIDVIFRNVLDILGDDTVLVVPPGCAAQFSGTGPEASVTVAGVQGNLENSAAIASGSAEGMISMDHALLKLYRQEKISLKTALHYADNPDQIQRQIR